MLQPTTFAIITATQPYRNKDFPVHQAEASPIAPDAPTASLPVMADLANNIREFDCIVIATDHDIFEHELLQAHSQIIVDTRGRLSRYSNVVPA